MTDDDVIDLTSNDDVADDRRRQNSFDWERIRTIRARNEPIGREISADVIDMIEADDADAAADHASSVANVLPEELPLPAAAAKPKQSHPLKIIEAAKKRRREQKAALEEAKRKEREEKAALEEAKRKEREKFNPKSIPGGCNFIIIDDDDDEDDEPKKPPPRKRKTSRSSSKGGKRKKTAVSVERPTQNSEPSFDREKDFNYNFSQEEALEMQERLLKEAAARVQSQAFFHVGYSEVPSIVTPLFDIAERYPCHWQWKNPYACLGLPPNSSDALVKSQYRKLARLYHPDKSKLQNTSSKFHGIAQAYRKLTQNAS